MDRSHWYDFPAYLITRIVLCVVQALPLDMAARWSRSLAWLFADVLRLRHAIVEENLQCAFPELSAEERRRLTREMWEHLLLMVVEVVQAPRKIHDSNWRDYVTVQQKREIVSRLIDDRASVFVSGHYGNFELSSFMLGIFGFPSYTIVRPLDNKYMDRAIQRFRKASGQHLLPKKGSAQQVDAILKGGGVLALLADQHAGPKGMWIDFFGRPASTHKAIGLFALGADAPLVMSYCRRVGNRPLQYEMGAPGIADPRSGKPEVAHVRALTEWYTRQLEAMIRVEPEQYWWLHRRWRDKKPRRTLAAAA